MPGNQPPEEPAPAGAQAQRPDDSRPGPVEPRAAALAVDPTRLMSDPRRQAPSTTGRAVEDQTSRVPEAALAPDRVPAT
eukprot:9638933-Alexandrium_andersonii.AAC.1